MAQPLLHSRLGVCHHMEFSLDCSPFPRHRSLHCGLYQRAALMAKAAHTPISVETTLGGLLSDAQSELEELGEEMRDVFENTPDGFKGSSVGEAREAAAEALESLNFPELSDTYADEKLTYSSHPLKSKASRNDRRNVAVNKIDQVISLLTGIKEEEEAKEEDKQDTDK